PKRCGHMVGKKVVPAELAEAKIRAACAERLNPETWILARTDARAVYDLDEAMRRAERYLRAGADGIFIEAPRSIDELERIGRASTCRRSAIRAAGPRNPHSIAFSPFHVAVMSHSGARQTQRQARRGRRRAGTGGHSGPTS